MDNEKKCAAKKECALDNDKKMYYIETGSTDPHFNLAMEEYVFNHLEPGASCFMLWQNDNSIIIGKYQNAHVEINAEFVREHGIKVARRLSGGGAVYHDLGNLNFTFITDEDSENPELIDFSLYCGIITSALKKMGVDAEVSGRNDMTVDGKKFSGNAQYHKRGRTMHHGTILFDSDLSVLSQALNVRSDKFESKGVKSVRSRVTNLKEYLPDFGGLADFWNALRDEIVNEYHAVPREFDESELAEIQKMTDGMYATPEWNYGFMPDYKVSKERYIDGCGTIQIHMNVVGGKIEDIKFYGDFFPSKEPDELSELIKGCKMDEASLEERLAPIDINSFFRNLGSEQLMRIILE